MNKFIVSGVFSTLLTILGITSSHAALNKELSQNSNDISNQDGIQVAYCNLPSGYY